MIYNKLFPAAPQNKTFDLTPGDYVVAQILDDDGVYNSTGKHYKKETVKVIKMYPYIFECLRTNGTITNVLNNDYICGLAPRASTTDATKFERELKRRDSLCKTKR